MVLGAMLGIYTGILLSALGARPLWNSSLLGPLFLVSGLSTAAAFVHLIARDPYERVLLAKADNGFLSIELFVIILFITGLLSSTEVHINAAKLILNGPFAPVFLVFVVCLGIVIPLIIQSLAVSHRIRHTPVAPIMVIAGGFILRLVIVYRGSGKSLEHDLHAEVRRKPHEHRSEFIGDWGCRHTGQGLRLRSVPNLTPIHMPPDSDWASFSLPPL